jgi:signal transduction histidine kinase
MPAHKVLAALLQLAARDKSDWAATLQEVLAVVAEVLEVARTSYWSLERRRSLRCILGYTAPTGGLERGRVIFEDEAPRYIAALNQTGVLEVTDVHDDERTADLTEYLRLYQIASLLDVPVWSQGELVGVLCHEHIGAPRVWTDTEVDFALAAGQVVATALEARSRTRAEAAEREAAFLDRASRTLGESLELAAIAERTVKLAVPDLGAAAVLDVLDEGLLRRLAVAHAARERAAAFEALSRRHSPSADWQLGERVIRGGQALVDPELGGDRLHGAGVPEDVRRGLAELGLRTALAVPLSVGGKITGALTILREGRYEQGVLATTEALGARVAMAVENARLHGRVRDAVAARDEFISLAAHELRGPLTALILTAEALAQRRRSPKIVSVLGESIAEQGKRLNRLIDHMLDATRLGAHDVTLDLESFDLVPLVRAVVGAQQVMADRAGSTVELVTPPQLMVRASRVGIERVLVNLLDNAIKFGARAPIAIELRDKSAMAVLTCRDRGIGIAPEILPRVFEPYVRGVSPRSYGGLGLGLSVARNIVNAHGGDITIASRPREGTTVTVRLPKAGPASGEADVAR